MSDEREREISVLANAFGYILYGGDPDRTDDYTIHITSEQAEVVNRAAERAWEQLNAYREGK